MQSNINKVYTRLVEAEMGSRISAVLENGIDYKSSLKDLLIQQGYVEKVDYDTVFDWKTCFTYFIKLKEILPAKELNHTIQVGDIFYNSWGWEQTNIDFYQVVAITKKTVKIRQVNQHCDYDAALMSGKTVAIMDDFMSDEVFVKKPDFRNGKWRLNFEYGNGCLWDGNELTYSTYA